MGTSSEFKEGFPAGLRVLVVDDDPLCLKIIERMLKRCNYTVTCCSRGSEAISLLRQKRNDFDLVLSDVIMPDVNGFRLLEIVGLEIDVPVIMMSANEEVSNVLKGIHHGACDYLLKPVRIEELKNVWQHVVRRRRIAEEGKGEADEGQGNKKRLKRDEENGEGNPPKKPRVVWTAQLHQQFVSAVTQLGIDKAVPKRILDLMNVNGLTRENVASHLQKYRLYLKRLSNMQHGQGHIQMHSHIGGTPLNPYENPANPLNQAHMAQSGLLNTNQIMFNNSAMAVGQPSVQGYMPQQPNPQFMNYSQPMVSPNLSEMHNFALDSVGVPQNKPDASATGSHLKPYTNPPHSVDPLNTQSQDAQVHHTNHGNMMSGDISHTQQQASMYPHLSSAQGVPLASQSPMLGRMGRSDLNGNQDHSGVFGNVNVKDPLANGMAVDSTQHSLQANNNDSVKMETGDSLLLSNSGDDDSGQREIASSDNSDILDFILKDVSFADDMAVLDF